MCRVVLPADPQTLLEELQARIQAKTSPEQPVAAEVSAAGAATLQVDQQSGISVREPSGDRAPTLTEPESSKRTWSE